MPPEQTPQQPQPAAPPPQPQQTAPPTGEPKTNGLAIAGLICAFIFPVIGIVLSGIALSQIKKHQEGGHGLALTGLIISIVLTVVQTLFIVLLVLGTISGVQTKARDAERETDIKALQGQLEYYYDQNAMYPTFDELNDPTWRATNMKGLDEEAVRDPANTSGKAVLVANPTQGAYAYASFGKSDILDKAQCDNKKVMCSRYALGATLDTGQTYIKESLN